MIVHRKVSVTQEILNLHDTCRTDAHEFLLERADCGRIQPCHEQIRVNATPCPPCRVYNQIFRQDGDPADMNDV